MLTTPNKRVDWVNHCKRYLAALLMFCVTLATQANDVISSTVLYFEESELGIEPYSTRFIIADNILRIDDGHADGSYILFDAVSGSLYSVTKSEQTILKIPLKRDTHISGLRKKFENLHTRLVIIDDKAGPKVDGISSVEYELKVDQTVCARFSSVDGLLESELQLLRAYERAIAANNARNINNQPEEYITDCMLANELFVADLYLSKGFPVMLTHIDGLQRFLTDYKQMVVVDAELLERPKGYTEFTLDEKIGL